MGLFFRLDRGGETYDLCAQLNAAFDDKTIVRILRQAHPHNLPYLADQLSGDLAALETQKMETKGEPNDKIQSKARKACC